MYIDLFFKIYIYNKYQKTFILRSSVSLFFWLIAHYLKFQILMIFKIISLMSSLFSSNFT